MQKTLLPSDQTPALHYGYYQRLANRALPAIALFTLVVTAWLTLTPGAADALHLPLAPLNPGLPTWVSDDVKAWLANSNHDEAITAHKILLTLGLAYTGVLISYFIWPAQGDKALDDINHAIPAAVGAVLEGVYPLVTAALGMALDTVHFLVMTGADSDAACGSLFDKGSTPDATPRSASAIAHNPNAGVERVHVALRVNQAPLEHDAPAVKVTLRVGDAQAVSANSSGQRSIGFGGRQVSVTQAARLGNPNPTGGSAGATGDLEDGDRTSPASQVPRIRR